MWPIRTLPHFGHCFVRFIGVHDTVALRAVVVVLCRGVTDDDKEHAIAALLAPSRKRTASPRWLWAAALLIGVGCAIAFVVVMVRGGEPTSSGPTPSTATGSGFPAGLAVGVGIGIAIGWFAARRAQSSADAAEGHSSRSKP